jgi:MazG family protein
MPWKKKARAAKRKAASPRPGGRKAQPKGKLEAMTRLNAAAQRREIGKHFELLIGLQARLRAPNGCPWDREQTHDSLRTYLLEETYEVLEALDSGDPKKVEGELGDLLLQIVFHSQLAAEAGKFDIRDVIDHIYTKMVRRHPHVFGDVDASTSAEVLKNWDQIKAKERAGESAAKVSGNSGTARRSVLDGVPGTLPALFEAHQLTRRAANVGFDWQRVEGLFEKLAEETGELKGAVGQKDGAAREEEVGDLLFVCVNLARFLGLDAEIALKKANRKFAARFRGMERIAAARGRELGRLTAEELESLWSEVKSAAAGKRASSHG